MKRETLELFIAAVSAYRGLDLTPESDKLFEVLLKQAKKHALCNVVYNNITYTASFDGTQVTLAASYVSKSIACVTVFEDENKMAHLEVISFAKKHNESLKKDKVDPFDWDE